MKLKFFIPVALSLNVATASAQNDSIPFLHLDDAVVTGTRGTSTGWHLPFTVSVVDRATLTAQQRTNVLPTLSEQVPGLFLTQRGMLGYGVSGGAAGGITVRGLSSGTGQVLVLVDGHPQYQGVYGHSIADSYETMMADRVEVLRGPASVLYGGNAMGGVINIVTRGPKADGVYNHINVGAGSWGTFQAEASNVVRKGRLSTTVAANYGRSDNHQPRMDFEQYGCYAKLAYDLNDAWRAFADADVTHFNASNPFRTDIRNGELIVGELYEGDQWITRGVATAGVENHYGNTDGRISAYCNWGRHKINDGYGPTYHNNVPQTQFFRSKDALTGVTAYQSASFFTGNRITLGLDYQNIYADAYYTSCETGEVVPQKGPTTVDKRMHEFAAYVDFRQDISTWLTLDAGVRFDNHSVSGSEWVPQAGLVVRPVSTAEIKATAGKGFRNPTAKDMYLYGMANDQLRAERLWNYELAWRQRLAGGRVSYGVNLFWLEGDNMIQTVSGKNINTGEISNRGVEADLSWRLNNHWTLTTNHAYLHMDNHIVAAPEYQGYLGASLRYGRWSANAGLQQVCGLYTAVGTKEDMKETFTLLNAVVNYDLLRCLTLWVKGDNLLAQKYEINAGYPMPSATFMAGVNLKF